MGLKLDLSFTDLLMAIIMGTLTGLGLLAMIVLLDSDIGGMQILMSYAAAICVAGYFIIINLKLKKDKEVKNGRKRRS